MRHIGWQGSTFLIGGRNISGYTQSWIRCWKSVGCTPSSTTSMCDWQTIDDSELRGRPQHLCGMPGDRPKARFGAQVVVVGTEDVLGQRLMQLNVAIEPFCSSLEPFGHGCGGIHCRGTVDALESSVMWYCYARGLIFWGEKTAGLGKGPNCVGP